MSVKSVWWSVTAFGDEIELCEGKLPAFVRAIYGGREICPTTGTLHFQGAVQLYEQSRMAKIKSWLKRAHLEPARAVDALKQYAMKQETAVGEKTIRKNPVVHYSADEMCLRLALAGSLSKGQTDRQTDGPGDYYRRVRKILGENPELAGQLMNPSLRNFWINTAQVWIDRAIVLQPDPLPTQEEGIAEASECTCQDSDRYCAYCVDTADNVLNSWHDSGMYHEEVDPPTLFSQQGKALGDYITDWDKIDVEIINGASQTVPSQSEG